MDASVLNAAYEQLLDAARRARGVPVPEGEWRPDLVLAHVMVADRLIAVAAAGVLAGLPVMFDSRVSHSEPYLEAIVEAAGDWDGLLDAVRRGGEELAATVDRIGPEDAERVVRTLTLDADCVVVDGPMTLGELVTAPASGHLPGHTQQLLR